MAKPARQDVQSILLVDDDVSALELYEHLIQQKRKTRIATAKIPGVALKMAQSHFYDMILIDVTMNYNGTPFGGFELYKNLVGRYGDASLMLYSQYVNEDLLSQYGYDFNFFEKGDNELEFVGKVLARCDVLRKEQSCFVAMPFHRSYDPIYQVIRDCVKTASYRSVRVDEQAFNKSIVAKIFEEIHKAKLVIVLATDQNPNVFYECGYAVALNKEVITLTDVFASLPFDIRDRNAIAYGKSLTLLRTQLVRKLNMLTK